jgi:hypothetical protein
MIFSFKNRFVLLFTLNNCKRSLNDTNEHIYLIMSTHEHLLPNINDDDDDDDDNDDDDDDDDDNDNDCLFTFTFDL